MAGFPDILAAMEPQDDGFRVVVPESWHQGRTAYGGFSSALALAVAQRQRPDLPALRSAEVSMIAPVNGTVEVRARVLRQGKNATWIAAEIEGEKGIALTASFVFMGPVDSAVRVHDRPVPEGLIPVGEAQTFANPHAPAFLQNHFEVRFALPKGVAKQPDLCWWLRPMAREGLDPFVELLLIGDGLPPGVMPLLAARGPVSTMQWHCGFLSAAPRTDDGWWLLRSTGDYAEAGCSSQQMSIWNARGEAVAAGMQSIALFG
jgi:acyl-CoA thioesterase